MFKKILKVGLPVLGVGGAVLASNATYAAVPSATSTLDTLAGSIINTGVSLATTVITTYWPYILVFGILTAIIAIFVKFSHLGTGKGK